MKYNFRDMTVYQKSKDLAHQLYLISRQFPNFEERELGSQLRRSSSSIVLNIAESKQEYVGKEITRLNDAYGSASEVKAIMDLILLRNYINEKEYQEFENQLTEIQKMLYVLIKRLRTENNSAV
ncbi:four helix bundle protein [Butyricicoccus sp. 1XD8-22]|nr:four helix bundle protein [Butyricicoccus sp. 1XD8-22]